MAFRHTTNGGASVSLLEQSVYLGENPVFRFDARRARYLLSESRFSELERKVGGKFHLKLNTSSRPIANKYHEGKMKRTLKRELKVLEIAELEANGTRALVEIAGGCKIWALENPRSSLE